MSFHAWLLSVTIAAAAAVIKYFRHRPSAVFVRQQILLFTVTNIILQLRIELFPPNPLKIVTTFPSRRYRVSFSSKTFDQNVCKKKNHIYYFSVRLLVISLQAIDFHNTYLQQPISIFLYGKSILLLLLFTIIYTRFLYSSPTARLSARILQENIRTREYRCYNTHSRRTTKPHWVFGLKWPSTSDIRLKRMCTYYTNNNIENNFHNNFIFVCECVCVCVHTMVGDDGQYEFIVTYKYRSWVNIYSE